VAPGGLDARGATASVLFGAPGFARDVYFCSFTTVTRVGDACSSTPGSQRVRLVRSSPSVIVPLKCSAARWLHSASCSGCSDGT